MKYELRCIGIRRVGGLKFEVGCYFVLRTRVSDTSYFQLLTLHYALALIVFCAGNDFVLQLFRHIIEIVRITRHAHQQVTVIVRMLLGIQQRLCIHDVELYVVTAELEVSAYETGTFLHILITPKQLRCEAHIEQRTATLCLVEFAQRLYYRRRTV